jgi:hypothetical protein
MGALASRLHRRSRRGNRRLESRHIIEEAGIFGVDLQQSKNGRPPIAPIHCDLIQQGFIAYVAKRENQPLFFSKDKLLGPKLSIDKARAEGLGEWARGVAEIATHEVAPNYGWRHRFKNECRRINKYRSRGQVLPARARFQNQRRAIRLLSAGRHGGLDGAIRVGDVHIHTVIAPPRILGGGRGTNVRQ